MTTGNFSLYNELVEESKGIDDIDIDLDEKLNQLNAENAAIAYHLILHHWANNKVSFRVKTKFPYNINGTSELLHGTSSSFPDDLRRILCAFVRRAMST